MPTDNKPVKPIFERFPPPAPAGNSNMQQMAVAGKPDEKPSKKEVSSSIQELEKAYDELLSKGLDETSAKSLDEAVSAARQAYEARATRNEWGQVAEMVGRAIAQYGAAREGLKSGKDMSQLQMGPGVDWESRQDRIMRDYKLQLDEAQGKFERAQGGRKERSGLEKEAALEPIKYKLRQEEEERDRRYKSMQDDKSLRQLQARDIDSKVDTLESRLTAATQLYNNYSKDEQFEPNSKQAALNSKLAGQAGISVEDVRATKPGRLWGTNEDPAGTKQNMMQYISDLKQKLSNLEQQKQSLLQGQAKPSEPVQKSVPKQDPQILKYAEDNKLDYNKAREILINRGYKPAE